ncbi:MAG TPA: sulfatase-like hydrolase/transferase [Actinomycetota bacterium]
MTDLTARPAEPSARVRALDVLVSLIAVTGFAVAQPLYELLDQNAEFFLVRRSPGSDLLLLVLGISILLPVVLGCLTLGLMRLSRPVGEYLHLALLALIGGAFLSTILRRAAAVDGAPGALMPALSIAGGALLALGYRKRHGIRIFMRFGAAAAIGFATLFLFGSAASSILFPVASADTADAGPIGSPAPVVFVVFDEFPVVSLLDADGQIDSRRYPAFAALAEDADRFTNAVTVHDFTSWAVPAMLTGERPVEKWRPPSLKTYPNNLFTLFGEGYDVRAFESVTQLCPARICATTPALPRSTATFGDRWSSLLRDLRIVMGHLYLPEEYRRALPPIDETVGDFGAAPSDPSDDPGPDVPANEQRLSHDELVADRDAQMRAFLDAIEPTEAPPLLFVHVFVPHRPWTFLPTGQRYREIIPPAKDGRGWRSDPWLVAQAYQQHLLQVGFADRFIGQVVERLESAGLYDDALVIVTADHGITFETGTARVRAVTKTTIGEIAAVPLIVKRPGQRAGRVIDYRVHSIDILPTVAELLDIDLPWKVDGVSLLDRSRGGTTSTACSQALTCVTFGVDGRERDRALRAKLRLFPANDPFALAPSGYHDLLGDDASMFEQRAGSATARIDHIAHYERVDPDARTLPVAMTGELSGLGGGRVIAVAFGGRIHAVTRSYVAEQRHTSFLAMIPPDAFSRGRNDIALFIVEGTRSKRTLVPVAVRR